MCRQTPPRVEAVVAITMAEPTQAQASERTIGRPPRSRSPQHPPASHGPPAHPSQTHEEEHRVRRGTARLASASALRQVVQTAVLALTAAVVARSLGASGFGLYAGGTAAYYLALSFTDLGFGVVVTREMAKHPGDEERLLRSTMEVQLMWSVMIALVLVGLGVATGGVRGDVMLVLCPAVAMSGLTSARQIFTVRYSAGPLLVVDLSVALLQAAAMITLALLHTGAIVIASALSLSVCLNVVVAVALARRLLGAGMNSRGFRWRILRMAIPLGIASVLASLYFTIDQVLLGWLVSSHELGEYAAAVRLLTALVALPAFVMAAGIPGLARAANDRALLSRFAGTLANWLAVTALPICIGLAVFARPAVDVLFGAAYAQSIGLVRVLMVAGVLTLVSNVLGMVMLTAGIIRAMVVVNLVSLAVNVAGNIVLAPRYGVTASAWLTAVSEMIVIVYAVVALRRRVSFRIAGAQVWRALVATALAGVVGVLAGAGHLYAVAPAAATFVLAVVLLRAWPAEFLPERWRRFATPSAVS